MEITVNKINYEIENIYIFNRKNQKTVELYRDFTFKSFNELWETETTSTSDYIKEITLNDDLTTKRKLDLTNKTSFIIKHKYDYDTAFKGFDLYIELNNNLASLTELKETKKEMNKGEFWISKNYKIIGKNNFSVSFKDFNLHLITKEQFNNLSFSRQRDCTIISDRLNELKNGDILSTRILTKNGDINDHIKQWTKHLNAGYFATLGQYETITVNTFNSSIHDRIERTKDRILFNKFKEQFKNELGLKDKYIDEDKLRAVFKKYNIDYTKEY